MSNDMLDTPCRDLLRSKGISRDICWEIGPSLGEPVKINGHLQVALGTYKWGDSFSTVLSPGTIALGGDPWWNAFDAYYTLPHVPFLNLCGDHDNSVFLVIREKGSISAGLKGAVFNFHDKDATFKEFLVRLMEVTTEFFNLWRSVDLGVVFDRHLTIRDVEMRGGCADDYFRSATALFDSDYWSSHISPQMVAPTIEAMKGMVEEIDPDFEFMVREAVAAYDTPGKLESHLVYPDPSFPYVTAGSYEFSKDPDYVLASYNCIINDLHSNMKVTDLEGCVAPYHPWSFQDILR